MFICAANINYDKKIQGNPAIFLEKTAHKNPVEKLGLSRTDMRIKPSGLRKWLLSSCAFDFISPKTA
jgi:hypothetical protein